MDVLREEDFEHQPMLVRIAAEQPHPLVFTAVSGAHLYGFASADSDVDLRGVHLLPARQILGLSRDQDQTLEDMRFVEGVELDLVTHDLEKFIGLMLKRNGLVLEQLMSPWVITTSEAHARLRELAEGCITRYHAHHYLGLARSQRKKFVEEPAPRVKPLLYVFRSLLTGLYLMQTGEVCANIEELNERFGLGYLEELIAQKREGAEKEELDGDPQRYLREVDVLTQQLEQARDESELAEAPSVHQELEELLIELRLAGLGAH